MTRFICVLLVIITALLLHLAGTGLCASIVDSKHNLSVTGPGQIKATTETRICIFCHTPHNSRQDIPFLWNRSDQTTSYIPYKSSTLYASVGQPTGASKLCLSCHDGTIALGSIFSSLQEIQFLGGLRFMPPASEAYLGTDLSDDHPVSFSYQSSADQGNNELVPAGSLPQEINLEDDKLLQCTSCHDPHDDQWGKFLVMSNHYSRLCTSCHTKTSWPQSTHALSEAGWNGQGTDPWPNTEYGTVTENGCENCHRPHSASTHERLLKRVFEEDNCIICHNGNVAETNLELELTKPYLHPVQDYVEVHDAAEDFATGTVSNHVECEDCHNPHQVDSAVAEAPFVTGRNTGVSGVDVGGQHVSNSQYLYEICFKCHADNNVFVSPAITRDIDQLNTRLEFSPGNPSYHPVVVSTADTYVPSLLAPYTSSSLIYCTDCHGTDDAGSAQGPHGSIHRFLLKKRYETTDMTSESPDAYALCYTCHDRSIILSGKSGFCLHNKHISQARTPCSVCHDPHGISASQGNYVNNSRLINFDITVVQPNSNGDLFFLSTGRGQGRCALLCHNNDHAPKNYPGGEL